MGVNHCGAHIPVAQQFLDGVDVFGPDPAAWWRYLA
jgi:hypothetical protein